MRDRCLITGFSCAQFSAPNRLLHPPRNCPWRPSALSGPPLPLAIAWASQCLLDRPFLSRSPQASRSPPLSCEFLRDCPVPSSFLPVPFSVLLLPWRAPGRPTPPPPPHPPRPLAIVLYFPVPSPSSAPPRDCPRRLPPSFPQALARRPQSSLASRYAHSPVVTPAIFPFVSCPGCRNALACPGGVCFDMVTCVSRSFAHSQQAKGIGTRAATGSSSSESAGIRSGINAFFLSLSPIPTPAPAPVSPRPRSKSSVRPMGEGINEWVAAVTRTVTTIDYCSCSPTGGPTSTTRTSPSATGSGCSSPVSPARPRPPVPPVFFISPRYL